MTTPFSSVLEFLSALSVNNHKEWFDANRKWYESVQAEFRSYIQSLIGEVTMIDSGVAGLEAKNCVFRINRDVRFSADKRPYKENFGAYIVPGGKKSGLGGYYLHTEPSGSFIAGGIHMPEPPVLKAIREGIHDQIDDFKSIILDEHFHAFYPSPDGEKLKNAPKGFDPSWPDIEWLKYKSYAVFHPFTDHELKSPDINEKILYGFKLLKPYNDLLNGFLRNI